MTNSTVSSDGSTKTLELQYKEIVDSIDEVFSSYKTLYDVYSASFANIEKNLDSLPAGFTQKIANAKLALEKCKKGVEERQDEISGQVYGQRLVLIIGASESLLREAFRSLAISNVGAISIKNNVTFTFEEVRALVGSEELGEALVEKLEDEKNPSDKLNFQNVKQLSGILSSYFGITLDGHYLMKLHEFWQMRHIVIHNSSKIDKRFITNLKAVGISTQGYKVGQEISVTRGQYTDCNNALIELFESIDKEINRLGLVI